MALRYCPCCNKRVLFGKKEKEIADKASSLNWKVMMHRTNPISHVQAGTLSPVEAVYRFTAEGQLLVNQYGEHIHRRARPGTTPDLVTLDARADTWLRAFAKMQKVILLWWDTPYESDSVVVCPYCGEGDELDGALYSHGSDLRPPLPMPILCTACNTALVLITSTGSRKGPRIVHVKGTEIVTTILDNAEHFERFWGDLQTMEDGLMDRACSTTDRNKAQKR